MSTVYVGSARIDETGNARGGKAGDQTGRELSTQAWYKHDKGWRVFRAIDTEKRKRIAQAIRDACANSHIGYDQGQRDTLYAVAQTVEFDMSRVEKNCETDCSALVRVALAFAGISCGSFNTKSQPGALLGTGQFAEMVGAKYADKPDYLRAGDILVTRTQGHTVVVLGDGDLAATDDGAQAAPKIYALGERVLRYTPGQAHMYGDDVRELQVALLKLGYFDGTPLGNYKAITQRAVRKFQTAAGLEVDGVYGKVSHAALCAVLGAELDNGLEPGEDAPKPTTDTGGDVSDGDIATVETDGATLYAGAGDTYAPIRIAKKGEVLHIADCENWIPVMTDSMVLWVRASDVALG